MKKCVIPLALAVFFLLAQTAAAGSVLVIDGDFETSYGNFGAWTVSANTQGEGYVWVDAWEAHTGTHAAYLGQVGELVYLSQTLTTTPGDSYTLRFWLQNGVHDGSTGQLMEGTPNQFLVKWDGVVIPGSNLLDSPAFEYTEFIFPDLTATGLTTVLEFGSRHDPWYWILDGVSVTNVSMTSFSMTSVDTSVPVPGTVFLLGSGLLPLLGWRRRRKS